jgi:ribulose-phosphate 3-epimerase
MSQIECYHAVVNAQLLLDVSLWSADLANLESEIRRLEPCADSFHFDAADGHFAPVLLFFPDLLARLRPLTRTEFHVHLMATRPLDLLDAFIDAGADRITLPFEVGKRAHAALEYLRQRGKKAGISIALETPVQAIKYWLPLVDTVVVMGTRVGVKGLGIDPRVFDRLTEVKKLTGDRVCVTADGGIREEAVPLLRAAGADAIVPGSLVCNAPDLAATTTWLKSL